MGCNIANVIKMRNANDHIAPKWPTNTESVDIATQYIGNKPFIYASVNGKNGFLFMIDTGASISYLFDTPKVVGLNLKKGFSITMGGWGDEEDSKLFKTEISSLSLNGVDFGAISMAFLSASKTKYFMLPEEMTYDGVIGHDILRHFSWTFDRPNNQVSISNIPYTPSGNDNTVPFDITFSKLSVEGTIDFGAGQNSTQELLIDTGSRHYLKVSASYVNENIKLPNNSITAADFGLSGRTEHQRTSVPEVKIGNQSFKWVKTNLIGPNDDEDENWVLGSGLFNQYKVVLDYHNSNMHIQPYTESTFKSRYNLLGLELRKLTSGNFIVRYVFPNFPSDKSGFKVGDIISKINNIFSSKISQDDWLSISASEGTHKICLMAKIESCFDIRAQHIKGYSQPH